MSSLDEVLARLDKKTRERAVSASSINIEFLETPSISMNRALGGGFAFGRQVLLYGNKASGKSSFCLELVANAQAQGKSCVWMDAEKTFSPEWAQRLGVDTDNLLVEQVSDAPRLVKDVANYMTAGVDLIIVDSISSIVPMSYFEKDSIDLKGLEASRQIGSNAKDLAEAVKIWNQANEGGTLLVLISQVRNKLGSMYVSQEPTGGFAPRFFSSTVIRLFSSESMKQARVGDIQVGDYVFSEPVGREVTWTIDANKTGKPFQQGSYDFYFAGDEVGIDRIADTIDEASKYGIIEHKGAWFNYGELKWQGREKVIQHFKSLPDDYEILRKEVLNYGT